MSDGSDEKRREPRFPLSTTTVPATWSGLPVAIECAATDISAHGIFLEMDAPPPVETVIHVGPPGADVVGRVVFSLPADQAAQMGRKPGVGVQLESAIEPETFLLRCTERGAEVRASAAVKPLAMRRPSAERIERVEQPWDEVVVTDGVPGQEALTEAFAIDGYRMFAAKNVLEALTLTLRMLPRLLVVHDEHRALVEEALAPRAPGITVASFADAPKDVVAARRLVDASLAEPRPRPSRNARVDDPRALADIIAGLGRRLDASGAHDDAYVALRHASDLAPTAGVHTLALARALLASSEARHRDEAASLVERVARMDSKLPEVYRLRAIVFDQRGRHDDARAALRRCLVYAAGDNDATRALSEIDAGRPLLKPRDPPATAKREGLFGKLFRR